MRIDVSISARAVRHQHMAYNERLADRTRDVLSAHDGIVEKRMFGGVAFLRDGNMAVGVSGDELIVRVGPEGMGDALGQRHVRLFDITGRPMTGWVMVADQALASADHLAGWIDRGLAFAETLPAK